MRRILVLFSLLIGGPVIAMDCMPEPAKNVFIDFSNLEDKHIDVILGVFQPARPLMNQSSGRAKTYLFEGEQLRPDGSRTADSRVIKVEIICGSSGICASAPPEDTLILAQVRTGRAVDVFRAEWCGGDRMFVVPDKEALYKFQDCVSASIASGSREPHEMCEAMADFGHEFSF